GGFWRGWAGQAVRVVPRGGAGRPPVRGPGGAGCAGQDDPGPPAGGGRVADFGGGPAEDLLEQAEGVFEVEAAQERLPELVYLAWAGAADIAQIDPRCLLYRDRGAVWQRSCR